MSVKPTGRGAAADQTMPPPFGLLLEAASCSENEPSGWPAMPFSVTRRLLTLVEMDGVR